MLLRKKGPPHLKLDHWGDALPVHVYAQKLAPQPLCVSTPCPCQRRRWRRERLRRVREPWQVQVQGPPLQWQLQILPPCANCPGRR